MKKYFEILRRCALFNDIEDKDLNPILGCIGATVRTYGKAETIISEGEPAKMIGIVLSGTVQMIRIDFYGNKSIVATINPAQLFGETFACAEALETPVDIIATETTEVMLIDIKRIIKSCNHACAFHSRMIFNLLKAVADKNLVFNQKIEIISKRTTREKLMTYLLLQAKSTGNNRFTIPYDRQGLADYLEVERSGLSAEIGKLKKEKILDCHRSQFTILKQLPDY